jgi:hypothetical protein
MARTQIVERRAIDPTLTFQERRRLRYMRRSEKRAREDALDIVRGALALMSPFALWATICWAQSLAYGLGLLG